LSELLRAARLMGTGHMLKLGRGYKTGWDEMIRGYWSTRVVHAFIKIGLLDALMNGPVNIDAFATKEKLDINILRPLVEAMYSIGFLDRVGECFALSDKGRLMMEVLRGWFEISYGYTDIFHNLEEMLRGTQAYGRDFYRKSDFVATGSGEMENLLFFPQCNEIINKFGFSNVLDLGCGDGTFLRKLCEMNPKVKAFGIDIAPPAIAEGIKRTEAAGLSDRISLHVADIQDVKGMPAELRTVQVATIFFILHEILYLGEENLMAFLRGYRANFPNAPLIVFEAIRPTADEMRERPGIAIYYYLYHDLSHQKPTSRDKWKEYFRAAGFTKIEERYMNFARTAIYVLQ
jgi:SAM-dependent methyltransferase